MGFLYRFLHLFPVELSVWQLWQYFRFIILRWNHVFGKIVFDPFRILFRCDLSDVKERNHVSVRIMDTAS